MGSNKNEKRKPKSAVYRSFWAFVVYFHLRLISTKSHKREMTRNQFGSNPTRVRIPPAAPRRSKLCIACSDFFYKSERAHAAAPPFQTGPAALGSGLGPPLRGGFVCYRENIDSDLSFHVVAKQTLRPRLFIPTAKKENPVTVMVTGFLAEMERFELSRSF